MQYWVLRGRWCSAGVENAKLENARLEYAGIKNMPSFEWLNERTLKSSPDNLFCRLIRDTSRWITTRKIICGVTDALWFICNANTVKMSWLVLFIILNCITVQNWWRSAELIVLGLEGPEVCIICFSETLGFPVSLFDSLAFSIPAFSVTPVLTRTNRVLKLLAFYQTLKYCDKYFVLTMSLYAFMLLVYKMLLQYTLFHYIPSALLTKFLKKYHTKLIASAFTFTKLSTKTLLLWPRRVSFEYQGLLQNTPASFSVLFVNVKASL